VRWISLIQENVFHTHNIDFRPTEKFMQPPEVQALKTISTLLSYYLVLGTSTPPFSASTSNQKLPSLFFLLKFILSDSIETELFSLTSLDLSSFFLLFSFFLALF